jgi:tRNA pseudouridine55 synthase
MGIYINQNGPSGSLPERAAAGTADGLLIVDKPGGLTSHDVVARVRRILRTRRVGHTGTLDPFATGVLVICLNRATRLAQFLSGDDKEYLATIRLGYATDTGDLTGVALSPANDARHLRAESWREALARFRGRIQQVPPMYSAKKVGGERLYMRARRGEQIARQPVEVEIKELEECALLEAPATGDGARWRDNADGTRDFAFRVVCSSGTYVRTLAEDIGQHLGVGAHLRDLRRTRAGSCSLSQAMTLERLSELADAGAAASIIIPMAEALRMPEREVSEAERGLIVHGRAIKGRGDWRDGERVKLCRSRQELLAIAEYDARADCLRPFVVLAGSGETSGH